MTKELPSKLRRAVLKEDYESSSSDSDSSSESSSSSDGDSVYTSSSRKASEF